MKTRPAYLVIDTLAAKGPVIRRATQLWPTLEGGEIAVRVRLEIPDGVMEHVTTIQIEAPDAIVLAVEPEALEQPA